MSLGMFAPARRSNRKLRLALNGLPGAGKSLTSIKIAAGICRRIEETEGRRGTIGVIDTENGSAELYAGDYEFSVCKLGKFDPRNYVEAIKAAEKIFDVLIIDSLSPAWSGEGGALSQVDEAAKRSGGNSFGAWRNVTPLHNQLVDAMVRARCHLIATMRQKVDYAQEQDGRGKTTIKRLGLAPIQREGMDYEFDVVGDMNLNHELVIGKTRYKAFDLRIFDRPGEAIGYELATWLSDAPAAPVAGSEPVAYVPPANPPANAPLVPPPATAHPAGRPNVPVDPSNQSPPIQVPANPATAHLPHTTLAEITAPRAVGLATEDQVNRIYELFDELGTDQAGRIAALARRGVSEIEALPDDKAAEMIERMGALVAQRKAQATAEGQAEPGPVSAQVQPATTVMAGESEGDAAERMRGEEAYRRASNPEFEAGIDRMIDMMGGPKVGGADSAGSGESDPSDSFVIPNQPRRESPEKPPRKSRKAEPVPAVS